MFIKTEDHYIIDTDFTEVYGWIAHPDYYGAGGWYGMFYVYESRGLDVAANMALAFKHWAEKCSSYPDDELTVQDIIKDNERYNPLYPKYAEEIQKYLMLV